MKRIIKRVISIALVLTCVFALAVSTSATQKYVNMQGRNFYTCTVQLKHDIKNQYYKTITICNSGDSGLYVTIGNASYTYIKPHTQKTFSICNKFAFRRSDDIVTRSVKIVPSNGRITNTNWVTIKTNSWAPIK